MPVASVLDKAIVSDLLQAQYYMFGQAKCHNY
jgi:hypothetical protein